MKFHEVFSLAHDERLYGLGEHFTSFDRKGQRIVSWSRDPVGGLTSTATYINVPFLISSRGFGLFFHHTTKITYELGNPALQTAAIRVGDPYLDYFFIYGPSPKQIIARYTELTGRATVPPRGRSGSGSRAACTATARRSRGSSSGCASWGYRRMWCTSTRCG